MSQSRPHLTPVIVSSSFRHFYPIALHFWTNRSYGSPYAAGLLTCLSVCLSVCNVGVGLLWPNGWTVGRIKMLLGTEVGLGPGRQHCVR